MNQWRPKTSSSRGTLVRVFLTAVSAQVCIVSAAQFVMLDRGRLSDMVFMHLAWISDRFNCPMPFPWSMENNNLNILASSEISRVEGSFISDWMSLCSKMLHFELLANPFQYHWETFLIWYFLMHIVRCGKSWQNASVRAPFFRNAEETGLMPTHVWGIGQIQRWWIIIPCALHSTYIHLCFTFFMGSKFWRVMELWAHGLIFYFLDDSSVKMEFDSELRTVWMSSLSLH